MERMTVDQLRAKYADVFGEQTNGRHKEWLIKRIAWRMQDQTFFEVEPGILEHVTRCVGVVRHEPKEALIVRADRRERLDVDTGIGKAPRQRECALAVRGHAQRQVRNSQAESRSLSPPSTSTAGEPSPSLASPPACASASGPSPSATPLAWKGP